MIVVSQDKRLITESLAISIEDIEGKEEKKIMIQEPCGKLYLLGVYATEERAKEVLQEIINLNAKFELYKTMPTGGNGQAIMLNNFSNNNIKFDTYEMPEK